MIGSTEAVVPYVGPRAFEADEHQFFYGRAEESDILEGLVMSRRTVLFFAQSGAGKSSLLKAGLVPQLTRQEKVGRGRYQRTYQKMRVLPVVSVGGEIPAGLHDVVENVFVFSALFSLQPNWNPQELARLSLAEGLGLYFQPPSDDGESNGSAPAVESSTLLIFDQFEELFTHQLERWQEREEFFIQVSQSLEQYPGLHVLFSMREDYIAELTPYAHLLPEHLRVRFRMERLKREAALMAVTEPARRAGREFAAGVAEELVDNLRRAQTGRAAGNGKNAAASFGEFVEPVHLQLVCRQLWQKLPDEQTLIEAEDVQDFGDVDKALTEFYEAAAATAAARGLVSERRLRVWFDKKLITPARTRGLVYRDRTETEGLPNEVVDILKEAYIIRASIRGGDTWYELAHDRLVEPILAANQGWLGKHRNPISGFAQAWVDSGRLPERLLSGSRLAEAEEYAARNAGELLAEEKEFLAESRQAYEKLASSRRRLAWIAAAALIVLLISLSGWAFWERDRAAANAFRAQVNEVAANANAGTAAANFATARSAESTASAAEGTARADRQIAVTSEAQAVHSAATATASLATAVVAEAQARQALGQVEEENKRANQNAVLADARRLAAQGRGLMDTDIRLAAQLAAESYTLNPAWEGSSLLLDLVLRTSKQLIQEYGRPIPPDVSLIYSAALSPDGKLLAWGTQDGRLSVWNYQEQRLVWENLTAHAGSVRSVAFSPDGRLLASGGGMPRLFIWEAGSGAPVHSYVDLQVINNQVNSLAFHPSEPILAASNYNEIILINTENWSRLRGTGPEPAAILDLAWSPDGRLLASGEDRGGRGIVIWEPGSSPTIHISHFFAGDSAHRSVAWSPDSSRMAAGNDSGQTRVFNMQTLQEIRDLIPRTREPVWSTAFSPDGKTLLRGGQDGILTIYSTLDYQEIRRIENDERGFFRSLEFSPVPGANLLVAVNENVPRGPYSVTLYEIESDHPLITAQGSGEAGVRALAAVSANTLLLIRDDLRREGPRLLTVQDRERTAEGTWQAGRVLYSQNGQFGAWALSPAGDQLALWESGKPVSVRELPSGRLLYSLPFEGERVESLAFSTDAALLAVGTCHGFSEAACTQRSIQVWDASRVEEGAAPALSLPGDIQAAITALTFHPHGRQLAVGGQDGSIQLWDLAESQAGGGESAATTLIRHRREITSLAYSQDGKTLASGSADNTLILWDMEINQPLGAPLLGAQLGVTALAFRDGEALLAGYADGRILEWQVGPSQWLEIACSLAGSSLTEDEQKLYFPTGGYQDACSRFPNR